MSASARFRVVVLVCAGEEFEVVCRLFPEAARQAAPFGDWFGADLAVGAGTEAVAFLHGGYGKIAAAASTQYAIDRWSPDLLVNLGTCGGFAGEVEIGEILLAERTLVYDIVNQIGDQAEALGRYTTTLDLSWLSEPLPTPVRRSLLVSADRDLIPDEIPRLKGEFGAIAGDWESGAIAYVASRNRTRCLILRGVSDLVGSRGGEAYGNLELWVQRTDVIVRRLVAALPAWIAKVVLPSR